MTLTQHYSQRDIFQHYCSSFRKHLTSLSILTALAAPQRFLRVGYLPVTDRLCTAFPCDEAEWGEASQQQNSGVRGATNTYRGTADTERGAADTYRGAADTDRGAADTYRGAADTG